MNNSEFGVNYLVGTWQSTSHNNMDALLDAMKVKEGTELRSGVNIRTDVIIEKTQEGDWKITTLYGRKRRIALFTPDKAIDTYSLTCEPVKATLTVDEHTLKEFQKTPDGEVIIERTSKDFNLETKITFNKVTATVNYRPI